MIKKKYKKYILGVSLLCIGYWPIVCFKDCLKQVHSQELSTQLFSEITETQSNLFALQQNSDILDTLINADIPLNATGFRNTFISLQNDSTPKSLFAEKIFKKPMNFYATKIIKQGEWTGAKIVTGEITSNFYTNAQSLGVPAWAIERTIKFLSYKINFNRALKAGAKFEIAYRDKELLYAKIFSNKKPHAIYKIKTKEDNGYYFSDGMKVAPSLGANFGQPLRGHLAVSSHFGFRMHPITKKYSKHYGVDFYAHHGSPVLAIADGVVIKSSYCNGYGHYMEIKHKSGYTSLYAHLSKRNLTVGSQVITGQKIGAVGSSGASTGSHLHLELAKNNSKLNPLNVKMLHDPSGINKVKDSKNLELLKTYIANVTCIQNAYCRS